MPPQNKVMEAKKKYVTKNVTNSPLVQLQLGKIPNVTNIHFPVQRYFAISVNYVWRGDRIPAQRFFCNVTKIFYFVTKRE